MRHLVRGIPATVGTLAFVLAASCNGNGVTGPRGPLPFAAATRSCGPTDGPAVAILLSRSPIIGLEPQGSFARILIWIGVDQIAGRTLTVGDGGFAHAAWVSNPARSVSAESGFIVIQSVSADNEIRGSVNLSFAGSRVAGSFVAKWVTSNMLCG